MTRGDELAGLTPNDVDRLINSGHIGAYGDPYMVDRYIAGNVWEQYALERIFTEDVKQAHQSGMIHIHDLDCPLRFYSAAHSLEYVKKYGLSNGSPGTPGSPAADARMLTAQLASFMTAMQPYCARTLHIGHLNVLYAPLVETLGEEDLRREAEHVILCGSRLAVCGDSQESLPVFHVHTGIPLLLNRVPAIGLFGKYTGRSYATYSDAATRFCRALLDAWNAFAARGHPFVTPTCSFHVSTHTFDDSCQKDLLKHACKIADERGNLRFAFDRDVIMWAITGRLRLTADEVYLLEHIESARGYDIQNVTINLPQASCRVGPGNISDLYAELDRLMDLVIKAHLQRKRFVSRLLTGPNGLFRQLGEPAWDSRPQVDLDRSSNVISLIGLNECVHRLTGHELHESQEILKVGLKIASHIFFRCREAKRKHVLNLALGEPPAEAAAQRLARIDFHRSSQPENATRPCLSGSEVYYTNSFHLRADAPVDFINRVIFESKFHPLFEVGATIHVRFGREQLSTDSIVSLIRKTFESTQCSQLIISCESAGREAETAEVK